MRLLIILLLFSLRALSGENDKENQDTALRYSGKAILAYPIVDIYKGNAEKEFFNSMPVDKKYLTVIGVAAMSYHKKIINTQAIKSVHLDFLGGTMRPDVSYNALTNEKQCLFNINWSF
jgi:hypothetical protein